MPGYDDLVREEAALVLMRGSFWAMVLGFGAGLILWGLALFGFARALEVPIYWSFFCGTFSGLAYFIARAGKVAGAAAWFIVIGYASLPTALYVMAHLLLPSGAATYVTGPPSYTYFVVITLSGFTIQPRMAIVAGAVAAVSYACIALLSIPVLQKLQHPDPLLLQDITSAPFYFFKALMIFFGGVMTAILSVHARRLIHRVLEKERDREAVLRTFGEYVSTEVRDRVISRRAAAERLEVAVLFADIRGFSKLSEEFPPERVVMMLNEYLDRMVQSITAREGTIDKFVGDAIMAVFGGLLPLSNSCEAAVQAAREMRVGLGELNAEWERVGLAGLENGVGVHYGEVLMGAIGSRQRKDYTVIGDTVNVAARLEALTRQHSEPILISSAVFSRLAPDTAAACRALGELQVKGRSGAVGVYGMAG